MRMIADWLRDDSRDKLADSLNVSRIGATIAERGRHEEAYKRQGSSLGLIDITQGPVKWINVVRHAVAGYSPTYWYVFGIPSESELSSGQEGRSEDFGLRAPRVELSSVRWRGFPIFGPVKRVEWKGNDGGCGLISALSMAPEVEEFCIKQGDLYIRLHHGAFQGWTVEMKKNPISYWDWVTIETIARIPRSSE